MVSLSLVSAASSWLSAKQQAATRSLPPPVVWDQRIESKSEEKLMGQDNGGLISEGKSKGKKKKKTNEKK